MSGAVLRRFVLLFSVFFAAVFPARPQEVRQGPAVTGGEPLSFIGMRLSELIDRFGPPRAVYAVRGGEVWQDDVVFEYAGGDFYLFRDRVWQVGLKTACGISLGDPKPVALQALGVEVRDMGEYVLCQLPGGGLTGAAWPLEVRINFSAAGLATAIFIYRPDF
jgi:hypothetical protein